MDVPIKKETIARFYSKIDANGKCHLWTAAKQRQGYGMFSVNGKSMPAHRFSYLLHRGEIGDGLVIHQTSENSACVNPEHLIPQSRRQNKDNYTMLRISEEMIEKESVKYLLRLRNVRPELKDMINDLMCKITMIPKEQIETADEFGFTFGNRKPF